MECDSGVSSAAMTTLRFGALALLLLAPESPAQSKDQDHFVAKGKLAQRLAEVVGRLDGLGMSGAVLLARDGKVLVAAGIGSADVEGKVPNTARTLFELASTSKQFTAAAVCELVERRKLGLDDSIAKHLPGVPKECEGITVRHLLQHTSGIPGTNSQGHGEDITKVLPSFLAGGPKHEPGTHWEYWNQGYALLTEIIKRAGGEDFVDFCSKELFRKAGMKEACFTGDEAPRGFTVAVGTPRDGESRSALDHPYGSFGFQYRGMGGAVCHVWDVWRWDRALDGKKVLGEKIKRELFAPGLDDYALGWYVRERSGRKVHEHTGSVRGFISDFRRYPEEDACLVVLCNRNDVPMGAISDVLESELFGDEGPLPPSTLGAEAQDELVGTWTDGKGMRWEVSARGAATAVMVEWSQGGPKSYFWIGDGEKKDRPELFTWTESTELRVERGRDGVIEHLRWRGRKLQRRE